MSAAATTLLTPLEAAALIAPLSTASSPPTHKSPHPAAGSVQVGIRAPGAQHVVCMTQF